MKRLGRFTVYYVPEPGVALSKTLVTTYQTAWCPHLEVHNLNVDYVHCRLAYISLSVFIHVFSLMYSNNKRIYCVLYIVHSYHITPTATMFVEHINCQYAGEMYSIHTN
jgi:hypothetical protein